MHGVAEAKSSPVGVPLVDDVVGRSGGATGEPSPGTAHPVCFGLAVLSGRRSVAPGLLSALLMYEAAVHTCEPGGTFKLSIFPGGGP